MCIKQSAAFADTGASEFYQEELGGISAKSKPNGLNVPRGDRSDQCEGDNDPMPPLKAIKILMQNDQINPHLSPQDNAIMVLSSLKNLDLGDKAMASVVYALHVLKMDSVHMAVPAGLGLDNTAKYENPSESSNLSDDVILDWLVSSYTPKPRLIHKKKISFKSLAKSIRHAIKLFGRRTAITNEVYLDDQEAIKLSLTGVDDWDWDVWRLREASKGRPLQALGWHLLHEWGIFNDFKLDGSIVRNWLAFVESLYQDTPYHSSTHAADVLQVITTFERLLASSLEITLSALSSSGHAPPPAPLRRRRAALLHALGVRAARGRHGARRGPRRPQQPLPPERRHQPRPRL